MTAVAVTNNSRALQGVWSDSGLVFIEPGETRTMTLAPDHDERTRALPFLTVTDVDDLSDDELEALTAPEVKPKRQRGKK